MSAPATPSHLINPPGTVVVNAATPHGWVFIDDHTDGPCNDASLCAFVTGPGSPPAGGGSAELAAPMTSDTKALAIADYGGVRFDQFTTLTYSTYRQTPGDGVLAIALQFNADYDLTDGDHSFVGRLVFEPYLTPGNTVQTGVWQQWDALAGKWWGSKPTVVKGDATVANPCVQASPCTKAELLAAFPDLGVLGVGGIYLKAGSGWEGFRGNVDKLSIGVSGATTTFDFEPLGCNFTVNPGTKTMKLQADCVTTSTILIPAQFTLDGAGHTITASDPPGHTFAGAVVRNAASTANVTNLHVTANGLSDHCDDDDARLRGILFDGAAGSITNNVVSGVRQGLSGCQEGNAIEVRNAPFDNTGHDIDVTISGNTVTNYQKNGITANGSVAVTITGNTVTGDGPITYIAQNGIQIGYGATGTIKGNTVSGNNYTPTTDTACGILLFDADGVKSQQNALSGNERDNCNFGKGGGNSNPKP